MWYQILIAATEKEHELGSLKQQKGQHFLTALKTRSLKSGSTAPNHSVRDALSWEAPRSLFQTLVASVLIGVF